MATSKSKTVGNAIAKQAQKQAVEADEEGGGVATAERKPRARFDAPTFDEPEPIEGLSFKARGRTTRYQAIIDALGRLKLVNGKPTGLRFTPQGDETPDQLKVRMASLVARTVQKNAKEGTKYRTRVTEDGAVMVYIDKLKPGERKDDASE